MQAATPSADRAVLDYPNELNALAELDDVQGNGIFDPAGSQPNIHPDEGIFGDREGLPGYIAREQPFAPSEVIDINTGKPVMYVPGNAFMMDPRTQWMLDEAKLYEPGLPTTGGHAVAQQSTVQPNQPGWTVPLMGLGQNNNNNNNNAKEETPAVTWVAVVAAGLGIGALIAWGMK